MNDADIALAHRLADAAADVIRPYFRSRFEIEDKDDASPVTAADRGAEAAMREILEVERPSDGIFGEEYGRTREGAARTWVLDPIDGTRSFIAGRALFGTLIALVEEGVPVLGVINQPIADERWVGARGQQTMFNDRPARTRRCGSLKLAQLATTSPYLFTGEGEQGRFEALAAGTRSTLLGGDCHNYGLLAAGHLDVVVETGLKLYDFAALVPVVEGAGGEMRDWLGQPLTAESDGRVIAVGDGRLLHPVLDHLG